MPTTNNRNSRFITGGLIETSRTLFREVDLYGNIIIGNNDIDSFATFYSLVKYQSDPTKHSIPHPFQVEALQLLHYFYLLILMIS